MTSWKFVSASVKGTSHDKSGAPCQDSCWAEVVIDACGRSHLVCLVADGAGSASKSDVGADLACETAFTAIQAELDSNGGVPMVDAQVIVEAVHRQLAAHARSLEVAPRELACTLLGAIVHETSALLFQVGDGAIVAASGEVSGIAFWPEDGGYANATYFVTEPDFSVHLQQATVSAPIQEVALLSDGLQRLALAFDTKTPHLPFFDPMFVRLRQQTPEQCDLLQGPLMQFLGSDEVSSRTDDDKTLILATRR